MTLNEIISLILLVWLVRTTLFYLNSWQIREYRFDRMRAYLATKAGKKELLSFGFFRGILPRPRPTFRMMLIILITILVDIFIYFLLWGIGFLLTLLMLNLIAFFSVGLAVLVSGIPAASARKKNYDQAYKVTKRADKLNSIGITGSYGKSSTKEILVHLLSSHFGKDKVLYNPKNNNTEIALAKLILKNKSFFRAEDERFFVWEVGAYRKGEIETVCDFTRPDYGLLTGINSQHIELFGSQKNILEAKYELAEATDKKIFYNAISPLLKSHMLHQRKETDHIPVNFKEISKIKNTLEQTEFTFREQDFVLPWAGEFFVINALLAINVCLEVGMSLEDCAKHLTTLAPLPNALHLEKTKSGASVLVDLYAANPDGVMSAIDHLKKIQGQKVFVGIPLRELGKESTKIHIEIFQKLKDIDAKVFWLKKDYDELAYEILGDNYLGNDYLKLAELVTSSKPEDGFLLESRLPTRVTDLFK